MNARTCISVLVLAASGGAMGCGGMDGEPAPGQLESALGSSVQGSGCDPAASAGQGFSNTFFPQSRTSFELVFRAYPRGSDDAGRPLIDGVIGLSDGPASSFSSLGPIVRFNPWGNIDARNGDVYAGAFPYETFRPYEFQLAVDVPSHSYSVWVRHLDAVGKPFELLARDFAFRSEQAAVARLDNVGRVVDSAQGELQTCGLRYASLAACAVSSAGQWQSQSFPARSGRFKLKFDASTVAGPAGTIDAVIGAAGSEPARFADLAAIVRFRPDGIIDARNGSSYAADRVFRYADRTSYHITLDVDTARGRYSVFVKDPMIEPDAPATLLARDYAFRSEQSSLTSLGHVGQFVDGGSGSVHVCSLTIVH